MQVISDASELRSRLNGKGTVGFVPTMGALHEGHLTLARRTAAENDLAIMSIFVNPSQFGPSEDFNRYPRPFERDAQLAEEAGIQILFAPEVSALYGPNHASWVTVEGLSDFLEGAIRPGHFRGVATIVLKLLNLVRADRAYFGQKDGQQLLVIRRMVADLDIPSEIIGCPTIRDIDGLAMSSRNIYLSPSDRAIAPAIYQSLQIAQRAYEDGERNAELIECEMRLHLEKAGISEIDYIAFVSTESLAPQITLDRPIMLAIAVRLGSTRLIDNILLP